MSLWRILSTAHGVLEVEELTGPQWAEIEAAAGFRGCSGCRADSVVADETGRLWLIDTTGEAHEVDPMRFVAV